MSKVKFFKESDATNTLTEYRGVGSSPLDRRLITIERANEILEKRGIRVTGLTPDHERYSSYIFGSEPDDCDTHTALLIDIQPIKKDTAASLLEEVFEEMDRIGGGTKKQAELYKRIKSFLGDK